MPTADRSSRQTSTRLLVVLFSGGRGSGALTRQLIANPDVDLTVAINGYDDGASTGEVRRFLGDSLGPSDFRKNASTLAAASGTCAPELIELLDLRFPEGYPAAAARGVFDAVGGEGTADAFAASVARLCERIGNANRQLVAARLYGFASEMERSRRPFGFGDCSLGNLVFAGGFLLNGRDFNRAVDDYCALVGLAPGLIENVTDGTNAYLVGFDASGRVLATEEAIVSSAQPNQVKDIFLLDRRLSAEEIGALEREPHGMAERLESRTASLRANPRLLERVGQADLVIYAPGTQHSSLFPSYLTPGIGEAIASNLGAMKLLITNIQPDAEITGTSAVDLVDRAVYYLKNKGRARTPTPFLITHCLLNDPAGPDSGRPYVPLGPTAALEDPRLVRIGNFEDGVTGRHDAARVLTPFIASIVNRDVRPRVAALLYDDRSINKVTQTLLEMVRGAIASVPVELTVFYAGADPLDSDLARRLPFGLRYLGPGEERFTDAVRQGKFEYVLLFESSGMYRGEEVVPLLAQLPLGRLDAVWGSRRLSVRDIEESYRFRYRRNVALGAVSFVGSYALSVACLVLYGRYISDTLSGVRVIRASDVLEPAVDLTGKNANHEILSRLLRRKAEILELPVRFVPLSPERVKRTSTADGLHALWTLLRRRLTAPPVTPAPHRFQSDRARPPQPAK